MEETLTLHRLGVAAELGHSLRTTNIIGTVNSHLGHTTHQVKRRMDSDQRQRRIALAMWETEPRLKVLPCASHLPALHKALAACVSKQSHQSTWNRLRTLRRNKVWHRVQELLC